jgi:hypothetical protein
LIHGGNDFHVSKISMSPESLSGLNGAFLSAPAVPAGILRHFAEQLPELEALVSTALTIDSRSDAHGVLAGQLDFILDAQRYFGQTLAAIYQFGLYDILLDETADLARSCAGRGLDAGFLRRMLRAWVIALHAALRTADIASLVQPLQRLEDQVEPLFSRLQTNDPVLDPEQAGLLRALLANRTLDGLELTRAAVKKRPLADVIDCLLMPMLERQSDLGGRRASGLGQRLMDRQPPVGRLPGRSAQEQDCRGRLRSG